MTENAPWYTADGTREVTPVSVDGGRGAFKVRNPQHVMQLPDESGIVIARYVSSGAQVVLAPATVAGLRKLGVDLAELGTERPDSAYPIAPAEPAIVRQADETVTELNRRRYDEGIGRLLGEIAKAGRE